MACVLLAFKLSNLRVKWGEPIRVDNDESDTTAAEFDEMWKDGEPTETVGLLDLKDWDCEEDAVYDWVDDDTMSAEETMRRFEELGPEVTVGNRRNWGLYCNLLGYDWISSKMLGPGRRGFWQSVPRRLGMFTPSWTFMMALTPGSRWAKNYNRETNTWDNAWIELRRR